MDIVVTQCCNCAFYFRGNCHHPNKKHGTMVPTCGLDGNCPLQHEDAHVVLFSTRKTPVKGVGLET